MTRRKSIAKAAAGINISQRFLGITTSKIPFFSEVYARN